METINESELSDLIQNNAVKRLQIIQLHTSGYKVVANLTWKTGDWTVVTVRGKTREWVSLDRLCKSILSKCRQSVPPIVLMLDVKFKPGEPDDDISNFGAL